MACPSRSSLPCGRGIAGTNRSFPACSIHRAHAAPQQRCAGLAHSGTGASASPEGAAWEQGLIRELGIPPCRAAAVGNGCLQKQPAALSVGQSCQLPAPGHTMKRGVHPGHRLLCPFVHFLVPVASWVEAASRSLSPRAWWEDTWVMPLKPARASQPGSGSWLGEEKRSGQTVSSGHPCRQGAGSSICKAPRLQGGLGGDLAMWKPRCSGSPCSLQPSRSIRGSNGCCQESTGLAKHMGRHVRRQQGQFQTRRASGCLPPGSPAPGRGCRL